MGSKVGTMVDVGLGLRVRLDMGVILGMGVKLGMGVRLGMEVRLGASVTGMVMEATEVGAPVPNCNGGQEASGVAVASEKVPLLFASSLSRMALCGSTITP
jgi:hypothetical protein